MATFLRFPFPFLLIPTLALASAQQGYEGCTRPFLKSAASSYVAAQSAGSLEPLSLAPAVVFVENGRPGGVAAGMLSRPLAVAHSRSTYDTAGCATYTELVVTDPSHPYVLGSQIRYDPLTGEIVDMETMVTDDGDWLFDAAGTLRWAEREDWGEIPEAERDSRETIKAAGDAYCDVFSDKSVVVPWGQPCARLEGGAYTGNGGPNDRCDVGIPDGVELVERRYVIDEVLGTVDIMLRFAGLPDSHEFRVENGKLRYVHTMTVME